MALVVSVRKGPPLCMIETKYRCTGSLIVTAKMNKIDHFRYIKIQSKTIDLVVPDCIIATFLLCYFVSQEFFYISPYIYIRTP